jgi:uncharacterized membrane protein YkvA (DUF1232 family)
MAGLSEHMRIWARAIRRDVVALYFAGRDARTPALAKFVALAVAVYALSPIDLIPDFIPVLGQLDDIIIVPLGILLAIRLIPAPLMAEMRARAESAGRIKGHWSGPALIIALWIIVATLAVIWIFGSLN